MKFKIKKGCPRYLLYDTLDEIREKISNRLDNSFYSKEKKHYVEQIQKEIIIEVKIIKKV